MDQVLENFKYSFHFDGITLTDWAYGVSIMTCRDVTITSPSRHFEFEAAILNPKPAVIQLTMTSPKIYDFVLRNTLSQNKHRKVKNYLLLTNEWRKPEKRLKKDRK